VAGLLMLVIVTRAMSTRKKRKARFNVCESSIWTQKLVGGIRSVRRLVLLERI